MSSTSIFRPSYSRHITWIIQARIRILAGILEEEAITRRRLGESNPMDIGFATILTGHDIVHRCRIHILIQDDTLKFMGLSGCLWPLRNVGLWSIFKPWVTTKIPKIHQNEHPSLTAMNGPVTCRLAIWICFPWAAASPKSHD